jgi:hypothetical protein
MILHKETRNRSSWAICVWRSDENWTQYLSTHSETLEQLSYPAHKKRKVHGKKNWPIETITATFLWGHAVQLIKKTDQDQNKLNWGKDVCEDFPSKSSYAFLVYRFSHFIHKALTIQYKKVMQNIEGGKME